MWPTGDRRGGHFIDAKYFKGILAKLPTSEEAFKRVRV